MAYSWSMGFLYPLLWLGALAVAVPVWLHIRRREPENLLPFSAVRFLEDLPRPRRGGFRLRDPLLLAARALALLLLVAAFTWPYRRTGGPVVTASRVHILDATLSQEAEDGFADDRAAVVSALARSGASVQDAVVVLTGRPEVAVAFGDDRESAAHRLAQLEPSHQRGSYLEAFRLADTLLGRSLGLEKEIVVHGDFQENQWSENQTSPPFLRGVKVTLAGEPAASSLPNLALHDPRSRFVFLGDKTWVNLSVDLAHQGPPETVKVEIRAGDAAPLSTVLARDFALTESSSVLTLAARWETDPAKWLRGVATVAGEPDALADDDRAYFCVPPVEEGRVALLARSPYLAAALAPEVMRGRWKAERLDPATADPAAPLAAFADVLVIEASLAQSERVRHLVLRYLSNGRGVVLLIDRVTPLVKGFLRELGLEALDDRAGGAPAQSFRYVNVYHPIFQPFVDGELGDLLTVRVHRHTRLRSRVARALVYGDAGGALMAEGVATKGRLLVFAFGFSLEATDWPIQPSFIPFFDLTLQYARADTPLETSWKPGDLYSVELPEGRRVAEVSVHRETEAGLVEALRRAVNPDASEVRFRVPDEPGIYRVTLDGDEEPYVLLAVNPPPEESSLAYDPAPAALAAWTIESPGEIPETVSPKTASPETVSPKTVPQSFATPPRSEIMKERVWWWLALFGAFALSVEALLLGLGKESP